MNKSKIKVAIVGYGNIGKYTLETVEAASDMECVGVVRRNATKDGYPGLTNYSVVSDITELGHVDVAILAVPSKTVKDTAVKYLSMGINTVDSFDIHTEILNLKKTLDPIAKAHNATSIISAGWDPGSDSIIRALLESLAPKGVTYTNFGPGRSMGHTVAAKDISGVKDALSLTIPLGTGIHRRMVYVVVEEGNKFKEVEEAILADSYFCHDETHVIKVDSVDELNDVGHGVNLVRKGVSGKTHNQMFEFNMKINNPALTGQVLVNAARATMKQQSGCFTLIEVPVVHFLSGSIINTVETLV